MKPARFDFAVAADVSGARTELDSHDGVKLIAGSQSLGPMLNLRLARPTRLVDVASVSELRTVSETEDAVLFGAAITHAEIEDGEVDDPTGGWLCHAAANIAHRAVRNRGTLGGSLAHADPAADWVIVMTGLGASVLVDGPGGSRNIPVEDFVLGPFTTALETNDIIRAVAVPRPGAGARWGYWKYTRQVGEFAKASAVVLDDPSNGRRRCALGALGTRPALLADPAGLIDGRVDPAAAIADALDGRSEAERALHVTALTRALAQLLEDVA